MQDPHFAGSLRKMSLSIEHPGTTYLVWYRDKTLCGRPRTALQVFFPRKQADFVCFWFKNKIRIRIRTKGVVELLF